MMPFRAHWPLVLCLLMAVGCAPAPPSSAGAAPSEPASYGGRTAEFRATHHALFRGTVVGSSGQPLESIEVVTTRLVESTRGAVPGHRAFSDRKGRFTLPAQAIAPGSGPADTLRVHVVVVGFGLARKYSAGGTVPVDSIIVPATLVPVERTPPVHRIRLRLPIPATR